MTDADRISQLAAEVASLKAQLASASAQMRAAGLLAPLTDLPDEIEIEMLINLVTTKYEMLRAKPGEGDYAAQFKNSLHAISFQRKEPDGKLNKQRGLTFFSDAASQWVRRFPDIRGGGIGVRAYAAALIVARVPFSMPEEGWVHMEVGLTVGDAMRPGSQWRETLTAGLPAPVAPRSPATRLAPPQVQFRPREDVQPWIERS